MSFSIRAFIVLISSVLIISCNDQDEPNPSKPITTQPQFVKEGELLFTCNDKGIIKVNIEIAETVAEQEQGLMNRSFMSNEQAMLFIFEKDAPRSFWMHNTIIPLDIIYVSSTMEIVSIAENTEPFSDKPIPSGRPAQYVVEVNGGFCAQYGISAGCRVQYVKK